MPVLIDTSRLGNHHIAENEKSERKKRAPLFIRVLPPTVDLCLIINLTDTEVLDAGGARADARGLCIGRFDADTMIYFGTMRTSCCSRKSPHSICLVPQSLGD